MRANIYMDNSMLIGNLYFFIFHLYLISCFSYIFSEYKLQNMIKLHFFCLFLSSIFLQKKK